MEHATACSSGRLGASAALRPCRPSAQQLFLAGRRHARQQRSQAVVQSSLGIGFHQQSSGLVLPSQQLETGPDYGLSVKQMQVLGLTSDGSFATARLPEVKAVSASATGATPFAAARLPLALHLTLSADSWTANV